MSSEYFGFECGVLLTKEDPEFEYYSCNNHSLPYGFYDEDQGFCDAKNLDEVRTNLRKYVEDGVDMTYAVISFQGTCKDDLLNEILGSEDITDRMDYTFFKNKEEIKFSVCKIDGQIREGFLEKLIEDSRDKDNRRLVPKELMRDMLESYGYNVTDEKLSDLWDIYEDCQEWSKSDEMLTGNTYDEIADFVRHSSSVNEVFRDDNLTAVSPKNYRSLDEQIQSASTRAAESQFTSKVKAKEPEPDI